MKHKVLFSAIFLFLFLFASATAQVQKPLSNEEAQHFFALIRQTKEFKSIKERTDSVNREMSENEVPQEIKIEIVKKDWGALTEDAIFTARVERRLAVGFVVERIYYQYDKEKGKIVGIIPEKTKYEMK